MILYFEVKPAMHKRTYRIFLIVLTAISLFVLGASFYFQYIVGLVPCPLCLMQRLCVAAIFFFSLMGVCLTTLRRARLVSIMQMFFALAGLFFATRQLWLQALPAGHGASCMPGLDILMRYFPWKDVARALFWGTGDCAEVHWQMLGLSMPAWSLFYFIFILISAAFLFKKTGNDGQI
jgi:disulfide bond formation protein DsbB